MDSSFNFVPIPSPSSSFTPLPKKQTSVIKKTLISNEKKPRFFISSSEEDLNRSSYASAPKADSASPPLHKLPSTPGSDRATWTPQSRCSYNPSTPPELVDWPCWKKSSLHHLDSDSDQDLPGLCSVKPSPPPDYSLQPSPSCDIPHSQTLPNKSDLPKLYSSKAFITIKPSPVKKPEPKKTNFDFFSNDETYETIVKSTYTTRTISSPRAITTTHETTTTRTIICPKDNEHKNTTN